MRTFIQRTTSREDWATPDDVFLPLDAEFKFTFDACASVANAKCPQYFSKEEDALDKPWFGIVWMNPPYGKNIGTWVRKAYESSRDGATVVCLIPSRTCTGWWHDYAMKGEIRFCRGRVRFVGAPFNAPFPSAIVIFRPPIPPAAREVKGKT